MTPDFIECHTRNTFTFHHSIRRKSCNSKLQNRNYSGLCLLGIDTIFRSHSYNVLWEISSYSYVQHFVMAWNTLTRMFLILFLDKKPLQLNSFLWLTINAGKTSYYYMLLYNPLTKERPQHSLKWNFTILSCPWIKFQFISVIFPWPLWCSNVSFLVNKQKSTSNVYSIEFWWETIKHTNSNKKKVELLYNGCCHWYCSSIKI